MDERKQSFWEQKWVTPSLIIFLAAVAVVMVFLLTRAKTELESNLSAVILTAVSVLASWLATKVYAEVAASRSLRDYGVQVASNMLVLKSQIEALTRWVEDKRSDAVGFGERATTDTILEHIEETLRGFRAQADAAVAAIGGAIGDALNQYEDVMQRIESIRSEGSAKKEEITEKMITAQSAEELAALRQELAKLSSDIDRKVSQAARSSALPIGDEPLRRSAFSVDCPSCRNVVQFEMVDRVGETRLLNCQHCGCKFNAHRTQISVRTRMIESPLALHAFQPSTTRSEREKQSPPPNIEDELLVRSVLRRTNRLLSPRDLQVLVGAAVRVCTEASSESIRLSPRDLVDRLLRDPLVSGVVANNIVRKFVNALFHARYFTIETKLGESAFNKPFENRPTSASLIDAWMGAISNLVYSFEDCRGLDAARLTDIIFGRELDPQTKERLVAIAVESSRRQSSVGEKDADIQ